MEFVKPTTFHQWNKSYQVEQSTLSEENILFYINSLEWRHEISHNVVLEEINEMFIAFGRKLVIRRSDKMKSVTLMCCHGQEYRPAKKVASKQNNEVSDVPTSVPVVVEPNESDDSSKRQTTSGRIGCEFHINFRYAARVSFEDGEQKCYKSWRITSSSPSLSLPLNQQCDVADSIDQALVLQHETGHSTLCKEHAEDSVLSFDDMTEALRELDASEAESMWEDMMETHFIPVLKVKKKPKKRVETADQREARKEQNIVKKNALALLNSWYTMRHKFWQCYTKLMVNFGSISSQAGESMNHAVKRRNHLTLIELIQMTERVVSNHFFEQMRHMDQASRCRLRITAEDESWHGILRGSLTIYNANLLTEQLEAAEKHTAEVSLRAFDDDSTYCSCDFVDQFGLMCRHQMVAWLRHEQISISSKAQAESAGLELFSVELKQALAQQCVTVAPPRWTHGAVHRVIGQPTPDITNFQSRPSNNHQFIETKPAPHVPESKFMRQVEIDEIVARFRQFSLRSNLAAGITINVMFDAYDRLEPLLSEQLHQQSNSFEHSGESIITPNATDGSVVHVTGDMPANAVDPLGKKAAKRYTNLSTSGAAKKQRLSQH